MKKIFHSALGLITGLLLAGTVSAQEPNGTNRVSASHDTLSERGIRYRADALRR